MSTPPSEAGPVPPGWEGLLEPGEQILWQGRPGTGIRWAELRSVQSRIGLFLTLFMLVWLAGGTSMMDGAGDWAWLAILVIGVIGAVMLAAGLYLLVGRLVWDAWRRRHGWYTLTDRAAFVATDLRGKRSLTRYGIDDMRGFKLEQRRNGRGDLWFAQGRFDYTTRSSVGAVRRQHVEYHRIGFVDIEDAARVYALMELHRRAAYG